MKNLRKYLDSIEPVDNKLDETIDAHLNSLTKPKGSLGLLEEIAKRYITITGVIPPKLNKKRIFVMAADHGVAEEGVSAFPPEVTFQMVKNFLSGGAAINVLARHTGCETAVVDMGVNFKFENEKGLIDKKINKGTKNIAKASAMTEEEMVIGVLAGIELAERSKEDGVGLIGTGEMGIANTTSATAIYCALLGINPEEITGAGTGLDGDGIKRKAVVIAKALELHKPYSSPLDILMKLGGYEIAGLTGLIFGAAKMNIPVVVDGFISTAAAAVAIQAAPQIKEKLFFAHLSNEKGHAVVCEKLGVKPLLNFEMRLGEGTGAALAIGVIEASVKIFNEMATFKDAAVAES